MIWVGIAVLGTGYEGPECAKFSRNCRLKLVKRSLQSAARISKTEPNSQRWLPPANTLGYESFPAMKTPNLLSAWNVAMYLIHEEFNDMAIEESAEKDEQQTDE